MKASPITLVLFGLVLGLGNSGCSKDRCTADNSAEPGRGASAYGSALCLGDSLEKTRKACPNARVYDLGQAGTKVVCPEQEMAAWVEQEGETSRTTAVLLLAGSPALTPENIGPGSTRAQVEAAYGAPTTVEPFLGTWHYPTRGLAFSFSADEVVILQLSEPRP